MTAPASHEQRERLLDQVGERAEELGGAGAVEGGDLVHLDLHSRVRCFRTDTPMHEPVTVGEFIINKAKWDALRVIVGAARPERDPDRLGVGEGLSR